jgi:hypothetical protein
METTHVEEFCRVKGFQDNATIILGNSHRFRLKTPTRFGERT